MSENNCPYCDFDEYDVIDKMTLVPFCLSQNRYLRDILLLFPCAISVHFSMSLIKNVKA